MDGSSYDQVHTVERTRMRISGNVPFFVPNIQPPPPSLPTSRHIWLERKTQEFLRERAGRIRYELQFVDIPHYGVKSSSDGRANRVDSGFSSTRDCRTRIGALRGKSPDRMPLPIHLIVTGRNAYKTVDSNIRASSVTHNIEYKWVGNLNKG